MARARLLNPRGAPLEREPVGLSQTILAEARELSDARECARLDRLTGQLRGVAPAGIENDEARIAFWLNLYNGLLLHCLCLMPLRGSLLRHLRLFDTIAYQVGGHAYPLNVIEHGVLRRNGRPPLRLRRALRDSDPRLSARPRRLDPRIHFALNCGARSCPPIQTYAPDQLDLQLERATAAYLEAETVLDPRRRRVTLPRLLRIYRADFGRRPAQLEFAARYLPEVRSWLGDGGGRIRVRYGRFDWTVARPASA